MKNNSKKLINKLAKKVNKKNYKTTLMRAIVITSLINNKTRIKALSNKSNTSNMFQVYI